MSTYTLYISSYTQHESALRAARGIYICSLDADTGALALIGGVDDGFNPSYMALTPDGRFLYAANEVDGQAMIAAYRIDPETLSLTFLNREVYPGGGLCNINVGKSRRLIFAANYLGGNVLAIEALKGGGVGELRSNIQHLGRSVDLRRQDRPYAHCAMPDPGARFLLCCDLGTDEVTSYAIDHSGKLTPASVAALRPGEGPRHLIFDKVGERAFIITELMSHVISCRYDATTGALSPTQTLSALPDGALGEFNGADIQLSPDERTLYASVRDVGGHGGDVVSAFKVDGTNLIADGHIAVNHLPRSIAVSPDGKWLIVTCQGADTVQVIDLATRTQVSELRLPLPVCAKFAPPLQTSTNG